MDQKDRGDKLTYEQLEKAVRDCQAMLVASEDRERKWRRKYLNARKHLRIANKALTVKSMTVELLTHRLKAATDRK